MPVMSRISLTPAACSIHVRIVGDNTDGATLAEYRKKKRHPQGEQHNGSGRFGGTGNLWRQKLSNLLQYRRARSVCFHMRHVPQSFRLSTGILATIAIFASLFSSNARGIDDVAQPPRYQLKVGQVLTFKTTSTSAYEGREPEHEESTSVLYVVGETGDGGWHLVAESPHLMMFDLWPDGRAKLDPAAAFHGDPSRLFPRLPDAMPSDHWDHTDADDDTTVFHAIPATQPSTFTAEGKVDGVMNKIYEVTESCRIEIDLARGLPARLTSESTQSYGIHGKYSSKIELASLETRSPQWMANYNREVTTALAAMKSYDDAFEALERGDPNATAPSTDGLAQAKKSITMAKLAELLDSKINERDQTIKYCSEEAQNRAAVLGKPAPDWQLTDLSGKSVALKDLRGKVVVLDFWYRGCGWCMRAMPQVKQLSQDFQSRPVVVFGMNTDPDAKDAQFVVDTFALPYPTLRIPRDPTEGKSSVTEQYHVQGFPTLILIGSDGVVRGIHVGYSPTLRDDITKKINSLLGNAGGGA
jgi:peroxiredoxin